MKKTEKYFVDKTEANTRNKYGEKYVWAQVINGVLVQIFTNSELAKETMKYGKPPGIKRCKWAAKT